MKKGLALLAVAGLFVLGIAVGVLGTHLFYLHALRQSGGLAELGLRLYAGELDRRLDLSAEQRREVARVLDQARKEAEALRRQVIPQAEAIMERANRRLVPILTPEQREELETIQRRHRQRLERFLDGS